MTSERRGLPPERDERTVAIENASYRIGYLVTVFALLVSVTYRSFCLNDPSWDLLAIVILGGGVVTLYQAQQRAIGRGWVRLAAIAFVAAAIVAFVVAMVVRRA